MPEQAKKSNAAVVRDIFGPRRERAELLEHLAALDRKTRKGASESLILSVVFSYARLVGPTIREIDIALKYMSDEPLPKCWKAVTLNRSGKYEEAAALLKEVLAARPDYLWATMLLARTYESREEFDKAVVVLKNALGSAPGGAAAWIHLRLGQLYERLDRLDDALASYRAAMEDPAVAAQACNNMAWLLATKKGDAAGALPLAEQAFKSAGAVPAIMDTLGWVYYLNERVADAVSYLERARDALPGHPTVRFHLGMAYLKAGKFDKARAELQEALAISQEFPEADQARTALERLNKAE